MPIRQGTFYSRTFLLTNPDGSPVDITGWEFQSDFQASKEADAATLLSLTTANGGWVVSNGPGGVLVMNITAAQSEALPEQKVYFDVLRTDANPGPIYLFEASVPVKHTLTEVP